MKSLVSRSLSNAALVYLGRIFQFAFFIAAARIRGDGFLGNYNIAITVSGLLALIIGFGTERWIISTVAADKAQSRRVVGKILRLHGGIALGMLIVVTGLSAVITLSTYIAFVDLILAIVLGAGTACFASVVSVHYGLGNIRVSGLLNSISGFVSSFLGIITLTIWGSVTAALLAAIAERLLTIGIGLRRIQPQPSPNTLVGSHNTIPFQWGAVLSVTIFNLLAYLYQRVDTFILVPYVSVNAIGQYSLAYRLLETMLLLPGVISLIAFSDTVSQRQSMPERQRSLVQTLIISITLCAVVIVVVIISAPFIIRLIFGAGFSNAAFLLQILVLGLAFQAINPILNRWFSVFQKDRNLIWIGLIALAANITANTFFIPRYGTQGAAIATVLSYGLTTIAYFLLSNQLKLISLKELPSDCRYVIWSAVRARIGAKR